MRQIVLDTETTGLEPSQGHRIIEIGCVELVDRKLTNRHYHQYIQPEREVEPQAIEVHGLTNEFLRDKPLFGDIVQEFMQFVSGAELIIHNAPFDIGFINNELALCESTLEPINSFCSVIDTLVMARKKHPGQKNNLDALCKRYGVDNSQRDLHGALLDSEILADIYLLMTGGQTSLTLGSQISGEHLSSSNAPGIRPLKTHIKTPVLAASEEEQERHWEKLATIDKASGGNCLWLQENR
ncbi:MAG: DNA polymerase-3 subunit epsilon [Cellvibrionaceae bacterium]|jgi:DNA polymerase-3 subunit epsilon